MTDRPEVVCRKCRKPLKLEGERAGVVYFTACPRHPNNARPGIGGNPPFAVPFRDAAQEGTIGIPRTLIDTPRKRPLAV